MKSALPRDAQSSSQASRADQTRLTLAECIEIALSNQPAIALQESALGIAAEQQKIAKSYHLPQIGLSTRYTVLDEPRSVDIPKPFTGEVANVFTDAAAFFGLSRTVGSAAALNALDNPNTPIFPGGPTFIGAYQLANNSLPEKIRVDLLGENFLTTELSLVQPLWTGGKIRYRAQQAELGVQAAASDVSKSRQETVFNVTRAYLAVLLASDLLAVADEAVGKFRAVERLADSMLKEGNEFVTVADAERVRSLRFLAESERAGIQRARDLAYAALRQAMGGDQKAPFEIAESRLAFEEYDLNLSEMTGTALVRRPEATKAQLGVELGSLERRLAKAQFHPDFVLFGRFSTINDDRNFANPNDPQEWAVGLGLDMPLFAGGRRLAQVRQADHRAQQAVQFAELLGTAITLEVQQTYLEYAEMVERVAKDEAARKAAQLALKSYENQYATGVDDDRMPKHFEDRATATLLLTQVSVRYYQRLYGYNLALAKLKLVTASNDYAHSVVRASNLCAPADLRGQSPSAGPN